MQKMIANVINNNFNVLHRKTEVSVPQKKKLKELGVAILKDGEVHLRKLKIDTKKSSAKKQGELYGKMLEKVDISGAIHAIIFSRFLREVEEDTIVAYDLTDEVHSYTDLDAQQGIENVTNIFDGSKRRKEKGFVHHGIGTEKYLLRLEIHDSDAEFLPQKRREILEEMLSQMEGRGIWAFDRGNDDEKLFSYLSEKKARFLVRMKENRHFCICDTGEIFSAADLPEGRHVVFVKKSGSQKYDAQNKYLVIKQKHLQDKKPIIILCSLSLEHFSDEELVEKYLERWGVENQFRKVKQLYSLENILLRKWKRRKNFTALILFVHFLSGVIKRKLEQGKEKAQLTFLVAWESLKNFLKKESKSYNDYSFLAFLRTQIPKKLTFFLRTKYPPTQSIPTLFDLCDDF